MRKKMNKASGGQKHCYLQPTEAEQNFMTELMIKSIIILYIFGVLLVCYSCVWLIFYPLKILWHYLGVIEKNLYKKNHQTKVAKFNSQIRKSIKFSHSGIRNETQSISVRCRKCVHVPHRMYTSFRLVVMEKCKSHTD